MNEQKAWLYESTRDGEWHMTTPPHQLHMNMEVVMYLLSVMGELTKHSVENGILDVPKFLI